MPPRGGARHGTEVDAEAERGEDNPDGIQVLLLRSSGGPYACDADGRYAELCNRVLVDRTDGRPGIDQGEPGYGLWNRLTLRRKLLREHVRNFNLNGDGRPYLQEQVWRRWWWLHALGEDPTLEDGHVSAPVGERESKLEALPSELGR